MSSEKGQFSIIVYKNPTVSGIYAHFGSSLSSRYEFGAFIHYLIDFLQFILTEFEF